MLYLPTFTIHLGHMYGKYASPIEHLGWLFHAFLHLRLVIVMCVDSFSFFLEGHIIHHFPLFFCFLCLFVVLCCLVFLLPFFCWERTSSVLWKKKLRQLLGPKVIIEIMGYKLAGLNEDDMARYLRPWESSRGPGNGRP